MVYFADLLKGKIEFFSCEICDAKSYHNVFILHHKVGESLADIEDIVICLSVNAKTFLLVVNL